MKSPSRLITALARLGIEQGDELEWTELSTALAATPGARHLGDGFRYLLTLDREMFSGDERNIFGMVRVSGREALVVQADEASGFAWAKFLRPGSDAAVRAWLAARLADDNWGPAQFAGTRIVNHAPRVIPRAFVLGLLHDAQVRLNYTLADCGDEADTLDEWLAKHYGEKPQHVDRAT